jgi:hypothetical protein
MAPKSTEQLKNKVEKSPDRFRRRPARRRHPEQGVVKSIPCEDPNIATDEEQSYASNKRARALRKTKPANI